MTQTTRRQHILLLAASLLGMAGCGTTSDLSGNCGNASGSMYRPVVTVSLGSAAKPGEPTGLVFGSIGSLGDFDPRALVWILWLNRNPDGSTNQVPKTVSVLHVLGATTDDFKLFTPRPGRKPAGSAVFCVALQPGDYAVDAVAVHAALVPLPEALDGAARGPSSNGSVPVGHRFSVGRDTATYIGQFVVGSAGAEPVNVGRVFVTNELERDVAKALELSVKLSSFAIQSSIPSVSSSITPIRQELPSATR